MTTEPPPGVALVTLGCGRNEVDSDEVAGALEAAGYRLVDRPEDARCVLVNTCAFIEPARKESVDTILDAVETEGPGGVPPKVLVIGCMAQRYGSELAEAIPEAAGVVGFADYTRLPELVAEALGSACAPSPALGPVASPASAPDALSGSLPLAVPATLAAAPAPPTATFPVRTLPRGPWAYLRIAGGCDRVCTFCAIPSFRGRFASRPAQELLDEARWLVSTGVRELVCVSENTTSWGKDLPEGRRGIARLIAGLDAVEGLDRVRLMYLQPAEIIPELLDAMASSRVVAPYYDLSLQHASGPVLSRMGRSGDADRFLRLIEGIRARDPRAVFRSSFILGFPGETERDVEVLEEFIDAAGIDWTGFFVFSPEEGTPSATMPDQVPEHEAAARRDQLVAVSEAVAEERSARFVGEVLQVLVEGEEDGVVVGRSYREAPETDGEVRLEAATGPATGPGARVGKASGAATAPVGRIVPVRITATDGVDLLGTPVTAAGGQVGSLAG